MILNRVSIGRLICTALYFLLSGIEYAVILPTLNGYLNSMDAPDGFLGIVMASFSFTGLITAPIYGKISDKTGSVKLSVIISNLFEIAGNLLYFTGQNYYLIWISRLVAGIGSGSSSSILGMLSKATTEKERTFIFSVLMSMRQVGLLFGPGLNVFLNDLDSKIWNFPIDLYTSPGLLMTALWLLLSLLMVVLFRDVETTPGNDSEVQDDHIFNVEPENVAVCNNDMTHHANTRTFIEEFLREEVILCLGLTFMTMFAQTGIEAAVTPMTLLFFNWGGLYNSYLYCAAGFVMIVGYVLLALLSKRLSDRFLLLLGCLGMIVTYMIDLIYTSVLSKWNGLESPPWLLPLFCLGTFTLTLSLPFIWITLTSLFSKITSIETQGFNQGIRLVVMGIGQILGPIWAAPMINKNWLPVMLWVYLLLMCIFTIMVVMSYDKLLPQPASLPRRNFDSSAEHPADTSEHAALLDSDNHATLA